VAKDSCLPPYSARPIALKFALGFALRGTTRQVATDLRASFVDRAEIFAPATRFSSDGERNAVAVVNFQIRTVANEIRHALGFVAQLRPIVAGDTHIGFQIRKAAHAAAKAGGGKVHDSPLTMAKLFLWFKFGAGDWRRTKK
jgi:hypothetical protein